MSKTKNSSNDPHKDFLTLFLKKERSELFGRQNKNLIWLSLILLITFLSLGFSNGSLKYLKLKMDDPFIEYLDIPIPFTKTDNIKEIRNYLEASEQKDSFNYHKVFGYNRFAFEFFKKNESRVIFGRTIEPGSSLCDKILSKENLIIGRNELSNDDIGIILSQSLLDEMEIKGNPIFISLRYSIVKINIDSTYVIDYVIPMPVIAIVKQLPGSNYFATTPKLFATYHCDDNHYDLSKPTYNRDLTYFIPGEIEVADNFKEHVSMLIKDSKKFSAKCTNIFIEGENTDPYITGYTVVLTFNIESLDENEINQIHNYLVGHIDKSNTEFYRYYLYESLGSLESFEDKPEYLSLLFNNNDLIKNFQTEFEKRFEIKIDMAQIEAKKNYDFVSKLTIIIIVFLIVLSVTSIILFLTNILILHLEKIKKNIGTFKAFGLTNRILKIIYIRLSLEFALISIIISFIASLIIGYSGGLRLFLVLFGAKLEKGASYFNLFNNIHVLIAVFLIFSFSSIAIYTNLNRLLNKTPGDLIYNR